MDRTDKYVDQLFEIGPRGTDRNADFTDHVTGNTKARSGNKDRSGGKYSEEDFLKLPRSEQLDLAERYWNGASADFDDGTFQFSYTHFATICKRIGFRKGIVDTIQEGTGTSENDCESIIYIDHGRRDSVVKKMTISKDTDNKIAQLLGDRLSNIEKSKVVDAILCKALDQLLADKQAGCFGVAYRPTEEERLL